MRNRPINAPYNHSLFRRLLLYYYVISLTTILLFCLVWYRSANQWVTSQMISYNQQQLESLYRRMEEQHLALKQSQYRMYVYRPEDQNTIYNLLADFLGALPTLSVEETVSLQDEKLLLNHYLTNIERPRESNMQLFLFSGLDYHYQDVYYALPIGGIESSQLPRLAWERVSRSRARPSRRSTYTVPTFSVEGKTGSVPLYILYDYIRDEQSPSRNIGYVINAYSPTLFDTILRGYNDPLMGQAYILDLDGNILYSSDGTGYGEAYARFDLLSANRKQGAFTEEGVRFTSLISDRYGFYVVGELNTNSAFLYYADTYLSILLVAVIAFTLAALLSALMVRSLSGRVSVLLDSIYGARTNIKARAPLSGAGDEIDAISSGLNDMLERIEEHIYDAYLQQIQQQDILLRQRDAELYALRSQINPHFLYNTLEAIRMKAHTNGDSDTEMMIAVLARMFRDRIKGSEVILLKQELAACHQMMEIYNVRHDSVVSLEERLEPSMLSCAVLRDTLIPLIENAMIHGVKGVDMERFELIVEGRREGGDLVLSVIDNGEGFLPGQAQEMNESFDRNISDNRYHVGLRNVHGRIRMVYGRGYGLRILTTPGGGTTLEIRIQVLSPDELNERVTSKL